MKSGLEVDPLAIRSPGRPPSVAEPNDESALAWRREMERAQMEAWLSHATVGFAGVAQPVPVMPMDMAVAGKPMGGPPVLRDATAAAATRSAGAHGVMLAAGETGGTREQPVHERAPWIPADRPDDGASGSHIDRPGQAQMAAASSAEEIRAERASVVAYDQAPPLRDPGGQPAIADARSRTEQLVSLFQGLGTVAATTAVERRGSTDVERQVLAPDPAPAPARPVAPGVPALSEFVVRPQLPAAQTNSPAGVLIAAPLAGRVPVDLTTATATLVGMPTQRAEQALVVDSARAENPGQAASVGSGRVGAPREPIRLHADWSAEGVRLWLGMDASQAASLHAITAQLQRWLSTQGLKLLSMSCNGRVVVEQPHKQTDSDAFDADIERADADVAPAQTSPTLKEFP